jgi:putative ABC transport system permease protein
MIRSYLKIAWRNLQAHKTFSFVNIAGLGIGIASCLALLLYVSYEWNCDRQFSNYKNIYRVFENQSGGDRIYSLPVTPAVLAGAVTKEIPGIARAVRFVDMEPQSLGVGDKKFLNSGLYADSGFFQMLDYPFLYGDKTSALANIHSIVLTRKMALLLFGDIDVLGKTVTFDKIHALVVSGVIEDLPVNETLQFDYVLPWSFNEEQNKWLTTAGWGSNNCYTLVELQNNTAFESADAQLRTMVKANDPSTSSVAFLHPMAKWHLYSKFENGKIAGGQIEQVRMFGLMAIAILLLACINFMNLSTARSDKRAKEVGIRKTIGSSRYDLIWQFYTESFLFSFLASLLAILLLFLGLPSLNGLLQTDLQIPFSEGLFWIGFCIVIIATGIAAGSYPSLYLSSLKPIKSLANRNGPAKGILWFRQGLVVFQFTIALFMILATAVIYLEIRYIHNRSIGFETANLVEIPLDRKLVQDADVLQNKINQSGVAKYQCLQSQSITNIWSNGWGIDWEGKKNDEKVLISFLGVGYHWAETTGINMVKGRDFSADHSTDSTAVLINESAASAMRLLDPVGSQINSGGQRLTIIGVFGDFVFGTPFKKIPPLIVFLNGGSNAGYLSVRLNSNINLARSVEQLQGILKKINPGYPPVIHFVDQDFEQNYSRQRLIGSLATVFGVLAVIISCMGLFGLTIFAVELRRKEISIRKVLGASVCQITRLLSADFLRLVMLAALIAFPFGWLAMNDWLRQFDYRVSIGWWLFLSVMVFGFFIALATMMLQTLRAAHETPVKNLNKD